MFSPYELKIVMYDLKKKLKEARSYKDKLIKEYSVNPSKELNEELVRADNKIKSIEEHILQLQQLS